MRNMKNVFNCQIKVYKPVDKKNELLQNDRDYALFKTIPGDIIPQTGKVIKASNGTKEIIVSHKIKMRYFACKDIKEDMYFVYRSKRFDIEHILNDRFDDEFLEIFVNEVKR